MKHEENDAFGRCHPCVSFLFFAGAIGLGALSMHPACIMVSVCCSLCYYCLLKGRLAVRYLRVLIPLFLLISFMNPLLNTDGERVLGHVFGRPYTLEALIYGMVIAGLLLSVLVWAGCFTVVMSSDKFTALFGRIIPAVSLVLVMVLRLVPNMLKKMRQIAGARKSIGKGAADNASVGEKAQDSLQVISALLSWTLEGGLTTADAMRARGYQTGRRSSFQIYEIKPRDILLLALMGVLIGLDIVMLAGGGCDASFTPKLSVSPVTGRYAVNFAAYCLFLALPVVLYIKETIQWTISRSRI